MTVIKEIVKGISEMITSSNEKWEDMSIFFNEGEVNPSTDVPCIVIEPQAITANDNRCFTDNVRDVKISLYMAEGGNPRSIIDTVWSFEEDILEPFKDDMFVLNIHDKIIHFRYKGTSKIKTVEVKNSEDEWESVANYISVIFELKYNV